MPKPGKLQSSGASVLKVIIALALVGSVAVLILAAFTKTSGCGKTREKNDVMQLVTATKTYYTEYGRMPLGDILQVEDDATQSKLIRVLLGLDEEHNPRKIIFFESGTARKRKIRGQERYVAGLHPESGVFLDGWGNAYRLRMSYTNEIETPYKDVDETVHTKVIAWSLGKDGVQGSIGKENILKDSDDVISF